MAWRMAGRWRDARYRLGGEQMGPAVDGSAIELPLGLDRSCEAIVRPTLDAVPARDIVLALFDTHRAGALRYTRSLGLADGDGEDVVQDVFLALFLHVSRGGAQTNLVGWIFRVAHRLALRKRARDARAARFRRLDATRLAADVASSPEEEFAAGRRRARLVTAVSELPGTRPALSHPACRGGALPGHRRSARHVARVGRQRDRPCARALAPR